MAETEPDRYRDELARSHGWDSSAFDRRLSEYLLDISGQVTDTTEVSVSWKELGEKLGFDAVLNDLAVIWNGPGVDEHNGDRLLTTVKCVVDGLARDRPHAAVAVVASDPSRQLEDRIFEAGAQVIGVPRKFWDFDAAHGRSFLRSLFPAPDPAPMPPKPGSKNPDPDRTQYIAGNPDLSAKDVSDWWRRLTDR